MADKEKLIYADKLRQAIVEDKQIRGPAFAAVMRHLSAAPAVEAVEVVRCEKCKFAVGHDGIHKTVLCQQRSAYSKQWDEMPFDGFCSYGERREGE